MTLSIFATTIPYVWMPEVVQNWFALVSVLPVSSAVGKAPTTVNVDLVSRLPA